MSLLAAMNGDRIEYKVYNPFSHFDNVREIWTSLLQKCPHSYFMSWSWKELWIESLPSDYKLDFIAGFINGSPVMAFFTGSKKIFRYKFITIWELSLNSILNPYYDPLYCEYDTILIDPQISVSLSTFIDRMPLKWDELHLPRCTSIYNPNLQLAENIGKCYNLSIKKLNSYYVDLDKVQANNNDYLALLSQNRRKQIRRSIKEYEKLGKIRINIAENLNDAFETFNELQQLHQRLWTERGHAGIFSNEFVLNFHKKLISRRFEHGEIQLIKITAGDHMLGCLYNLIYNENAITYISGFNYLPPGNILSPGYICHSLAVEYNAKLGLKSYDFLEGEDSYKKILSTDKNQMQDITIQRRNTGYYLQRIIVKLSRLFKEKGIILQEKAG